jgi:bifunctional non-homologous end joining protein LigD
MLATLVPRPFDKPRWVYEEKYDGYRILTYKEGKRVSLVSRNGKDRTRAFSALADAVGKLPAKTLLLDGEVVAFDWAQVSRFQLLQDGNVVPSYAAFDCLYKNGRDLRQAPFSVRRRALQTIIRKTGRIFLSRRLASDGFQAYRVARKRGSRESSPRTSPRLISQDDPISGWR